MMAHGRQPAVSVLLRYPAVVQTLREEGDEEGFFVGGKRDVFVFVDDVSESPPC